MDWNPVGETFTDVQEVIHNTIRRFQRQYGGNFEDLLDIALLVFLNGYHKYDADRGSFKSWMQRSVWGGLIQRHLRPECQRNKRHPKCGLPNELTAPTNFDFDGYLSDLSDDAATVIRVLLEMPEEIDSMCWAVQRTRKNLFKRMRDLGWSAPRIRDAFDTIRMSLKG